MEKLSPEKWDVLCSQVWDEMYAQIMLTVTDPLHRKIWEDVLLKVKAKGFGALRSNVRSQLSSAICGQHEAGWLSFYSFFGEECNMQECNKLNGLKQVAMNAGWWWAFEKVAIITERPVSLFIDDRGRLHHESTSALRYPDNFELYVINGIRVDSYIICHPEKITAKKVDNESNAEIRRLMLDRYPGGEVKYIHDSGMRPVDHSEKYGTLYLKRLEAGRPICRIRVVNRTPEPDGSFKIYWLSVNPDKFDGDAGKYAQAAVASTWRTTPGGDQLIYSDWKKYDPIIET